MGTVRSSIFLFLVTLLMSACAEVAPTNPFDPATPAAQQEKGNVFGYLQMPDGFDANQFEQVNVALTPTDFCPPGGNAETRTLRPEVSPCPSSRPFDDAPADAMDDESEPPSDEMALKPREPSVERACSPIPIR